MKIQNLDKMFWEAFLLEMSLSRAILNQNFLAYNILCYRYKELAERYSQATFNWRL